MGQKPEFKQVGPFTYASTVCQNFQLEITKPQRLKTPEQLKVHLEARLAEHIKAYHSKEDFSQAAVRIVKEATENK